jgi:hypothetical protein
MGEREIKTIKVRERELRQNERSNDRKKERDVIIQIEEKE